MKEELAIRLEAWFDGELSPTERFDVEAIIDQDPMAREYVDQLKQTRIALQVHQPRVDVSQAWEAHLDRLESAKNTRSGKVFSFPKMVTAFAAIMVLGMALWLPMRKMGDLSESGGLESVVQMVETDLVGATPIVYLDQPSGWTVVWVVEAEEST